MLLGREAKDIFGIEIPDYGCMESNITRWYNITSGNPPWMDEEDDIRTINFAQYVDDVTSGLVTLDLGIELPDTPRGKYLQGIANYLLKKLDGKVSDALGNAGIIFKPNGKNVSYCYPGSFIITDYDSNGDILGCMFVDMKKKGKKVYRKYEWHRYETVNDLELYHITNVAFKSESIGSRGKKCSLSEVEDWANLEEDVYLENVKHPLFAYYGNPKPNNINRDSPLSIPIWGNCEEELKMLDIAWSRKSTEIEDSKHMTFVPQQAIIYAEQHHIKLPRWMKGLQSSAGLMTDGKVDEHVATLLTEQRISDMNSDLALISTKLGYDQGFFVLDEKTGAVTATQIEADDQSTIRTIKNLRDPLRDALLQVLYATNKFADLYTTLPVEAWTEDIDTMREEITFNFGDITYNYEEDKASWWRYRIQGDCPPWKYYTMFEGMSEEDAKAMVEEAKPKETPGLFQEE